MSSLFKKEKQEAPAPQELTSPDQLAARNILSGYSSYGKDATKPGPYGGQMTADLQSYEQQIPNILQNYMNRQTPESTRIGTEFAQNYMTGNYDPTAALEKAQIRYKPIRAEAMRDLGEGKTRLGQEAQKAGMLRSTGRFKLGEDLEEGTANNLQNVMANLYSNEVQNQLGLLPLMQQLGQREEEDPLRTMAAINQFTQRPYYQEGLDREYQDYIKQLSEEKYPLQVSQYLANPSAYAWYQPQYSQSPSVFEQISPMIQALQGSGIGSMMANLFKKKPAQTYGGAPGGGSDLSSWMDAGQPGGTYNYTGG